MALNRPTSETKHSKGEWTLGKVNSLNQIELLSENKSKNAISKYVSLGFIEYDCIEEKANARLIKSAPKLLQIAQMFFDHMKGNFKEDSLPFIVTLETLNEIEGK